MSDAIRTTLSHLARVAIVYLRQSSAAQVRTTAEFDRPTVCLGEQGHRSR